MIIDPSYFVNRLNLPQTGNSAGLAEVQDFIDQYEPEYLQCVLGLGLWQAFTNGLDGSGLPTEDRWADLLHGADFTKQGCKYHWNGFMPVGSKISPIAGYVFYQFVDEREEDFTLVGNVKSTTENNRVVNATTRLVYTWNRMVDMNRFLYNFLLVNKATYPEWKSHCNCGCCNRYFWDECSCKGDKRVPKRCCDLFKYKNSLGL